MLPPQVELNESEKYRHRLSVATVTLPGQTAIGRGDVGASLSSARTFATFVAHIETTLQKYTLSVIETSYNRTLFQGEGTLVIPFVNSQYQKITIAKKVHGCENGLGGIFG